MDLIDGSQFLRFIFALVFVLGLMGGLYLVLRRIQNQGPLKSLRARRLSVSEVLPLDAKHRAILLRRDDTEHLVILGPNGETVIENGIESSGAVNEDSHDDENEKTAKESKAA